MRRLSFMPKRCFLVTLGTLLCLANPLLCHAECSLTFIPIEESKYLLKGEGCQDIAELTFAVDYDTAYLFAPDVTVMGGRLMEEDRGASTPPGNLRLHISNVDHSAVFEATVFFQKRGEYPAVINFVTAELTDRSGDVRPLPVQMAAPVNTPQDEEGPAAAKPADDPASSRDADAEMLARELGGAQGEGAPPAPAPAQAVFERFRDFTGKKSFAAFRELFSGVDPCCRQTPSVVVADGRRTARIVISGVEVGDRAPLFSVSGGTLVSAQRGRHDEEWMVVAQPYENWWDVRVRAVFANSVVDFPLTVTPGIEMPRRNLALIKDKEFMLRLQGFLAGKPGKGKPVYPVWFREYLFTANCLAAQAEQKRVK
ncbi:MAG: hypothetical protein A2075_11410 [Geobacteraceae bacterium GWC2_58_44]|nr:MAG: hypothetical protein A2075_11410 [Geobacteraceae bacterium GWC2_58_44]HBG04842.1 hypothetical protein [Geobacter sp.]